MRTAFVVGASGAVGRFLLPRLVDAGYAVHALSRRERAAVPGVTWWPGDLDHAAPAPPRVDLVVACGPLDAFARWFGQAPLHGARLVAIGSTSIDSKRDSPVPDERDIAARLADAEQRLADAAQARACAWTLLRPTLIYGAGVDRSLTPLVRRAERWRVFPRIAAPGLRQPVHADDLAAACVAVADTAPCAGRTYALGGGERLAFGVMLERVRASLPFRTVPLPLPLSLLRAVAPCAPRLRGALARLRRDLVVDDGAARADFGWAPRGFRPGPSCWRVSA